jgi:hypothetical protein
MIMFYLAQDTLFSLVVAQSHGLVMSTPESKYSALSSAAREILPLRQLLLDINAYSFISCQRHLRMTA